MLFASNPAFFIANLFHVNGVVNIGSSVYGASICEIKRIENMVLFLIVDARAAILMVIHDVVDSEYWLSAIVGIIAALWTWLKIGREREIS